MGLLLRVRGRPLRPRVFRFDDTVERIVFGKDPTRCQVAFAPRVRAVGVEHAALERVLGTYRWVLNGNDEVYVDGLRVLEGDVLPSHGTLRLGRRGPRLYFSNGPNPEVPVLQPLGRVRSALGRTRELAGRVRFNRIAMIVLALGLLVVTAAGAMAVQRVGRTSAPDAEARLRRVLRDATPSVYRTVVRTLDGHERGGGTAFVVGPDRLATNVHVAESFFELPPGGTLLVRSQDEPPRSFVVTGVQLHPAHDAFDIAWWYYRPTVGGDRPVRPPGTACDVALLEVEPGSGLGRALPIAARGDLASLEPGMPLGYVGYPSEGLSLDGSSVRRPKPHMQTGALTSLTTFTGRVPPAGGGTLLQHSCPTAGGASGSPVLDERGRVVGLIHAGNFAYSWGSRIPLGVGVDYAQSAVFLHDLLDGSAQAKRAEYEQRWNTELQTLYKSTAAAMRTTARERTLFDRAWRTPAPSVDGLTRFAPVRELTVEIPRRGIDDETVVSRLALPGDGCYALLIWQYGGARGLPIEARVHRAGGGPVQRPIETRRAEGMQQAYDVVVYAPGTVTLEIEPGRAAVRMHVELLRAVAPARPRAQPVPKPKTPGVLQVPREDRIVERCVGVLGRQLGVELATSQVVERVVEKGDPGFVRPESWYESFPVGEPGLFLVEYRVLRGGSLKHHYAPEAEFRLTQGSKHRRVVAAYHPSRGELWAYFDLELDPTHELEVIVRVHRVTVER